MSSRITKLTYRGSGPAANFIPLKRGALSIKASVPSRRITIRLVRSVLKCDRHYLPMRGLEPVCLLTLSLKSPAPRSFQFPLSLSYSFPRPWNTFISSSSPVITRLSLVSSVNKMSRTLTILFLIYHLLTFTALGVTSGRSKDLAERSRLCSFFDLLFFRCIRITVLLISVLTLGFIFG